MLSPRATFPFKFLESCTEHIPIFDKYPIEIDDLLVYPLLSRARDLVIDLWQWFQDFHSPLTLFDNLSHGLTLTLSSHSWSYMKDGRRIATNRQWLEGLQERYNDNFDIPHGNYIEIDRAFLNDYLKEKGLRLGYLARTNVKYKEKQYDKAKSFKSYELIGVSKIII